LIKRACITRIWKTYDKIDARHYIHFDDEKLKDACEQASEPKIISIRTWRHPLSKKQRWALAFWCANNPELVKKWK